ncbi:hypothetical protein BH24ACT21_BH24ACT21_06620 [soil metagenome]
MRVTRTEEETWQNPKGRRENQNALERGCEGASCRDHCGEGLLPGGDHREALELLDPLASIEASWMESKKRSLGASERDEWKRADWRVTVAAQIDPERLVFVDEMGANTSLSPIYAYSLVGQRACCSVPRNRGKNTTLLSSMSAGGMGPSLAVDGPTDRKVFEAYVERVLLPTLRAGQVVVMDNLSAHKGERIRELIEERGCELLYLPAYSPDLNPIEEAFSKIKGLLRKAEARTRDALVEAMGSSLSAVSAKDARGFFEHCGYRPQVQLL